LSATTELVVLAPSSLKTTTGLPCSITQVTELQLPKSIPIATFSFAIINKDLFFICYLISKFCTHIYSNAVPPTNVCQNVSVYPKSCQKPVNIRTFFEFLMLSIYGNLLVKAKLI
jgi:hypothetical protein